MCVCGGGGGGGGVISAVAGVQDLKLLELYSVGMEDFLQVCVLGGGGGGGAVSGPELGRLLEWQDIEAGVCSVYV